MEKVDILGVGVDNLSLQEVLEKSRRFLESGNQHFIVTPNPEIILAAKKDKPFQNILNYADIATADGVGLLYAAKLFGQRLIRVTGVDLVHHLSELAAQTASSVYFLGAADGVAEQAANKLKMQFKNLTVAGAQSGGEINDPNTINFKLLGDINATKPKILFVAFGHGKQEKWIFKHLDKMPSVKLAIGIGGALDYISGQTPRAPKIIRRLGLEWLHRLSKHPQRWQRIRNAVIVFPLLVAKEKFFSRLFKNNNNKKNV